MDRGTISMLQAIVSDYCLLCQRNFSRLECIEGEMVILDDPFLLMMLMPISRSLITHYNIITIYCRFTVSGPILTRKRNRTTTSKLAHDHERS